MPRGPDIQQKRFILGVGAQKAGTTWLHHYLSQQPFSDFGFRKEYHVFDAVESKPGGFYARARKSALAALKQDSQTVKASNAIRRMDFVLNTDAYFDYFAARFLNPDIHLTGDFTPAYATLRPETFAMIDAEFACRGVTVFPVFLMRDPVYRLQSFVRMNLRGATVKPGKTEEIALMEKSVNRPDAVKRGSYPETLRKLYAVFGRERLFLDLYETMFSERLQGDLSGWLGLELGPPPLGEMKNVSRTENALTEEEYNHFRALLAPSCDGIGELTGLDIDAHWRFRG